MPYLPDTHDEQVCGLLNVLKLFLSCWNFIATVFIQFTVFLLLSASNHLAFDHLALDGVRGRKNIAQR